MTSAPATSRHVGRNYIAGSWAASVSGETYLQRNPMRPSETTGEFYSSGPGDIDAAVTAAAAAFRAWAALPLSRRASFLTAAASVLESRAEDIARGMTAEMGKPIRESRAEAARAAQVLRFAAGEAFRPVGEHFEQAATGEQVWTQRRPLGPVALITPWNFPCAIPVWKLAPALVYGNTVVLKVACEAPRTGLYIAEAFAAAELPAGVLNLITGGGSDAGRSLVAHPGVRAISFTGSVATGGDVRAEATQRGKRVQLELGGQNPLIIMNDADLDRAVEAAYAGAFWSAGQKCTATRRIYVQQDTYDLFKERFLARIQRGRVGDPSDPEVEVGPLVSESQLDDVMRAIDRGRREGGRILVGGERLDQEGYLLAPTVFEDVGDDGFLSCEEVFGPVTSLYRFSTLEEALDRANSVRYGLAAAIYTTSLRTANRFLNEAQAGLLHVNSQTAGADVHVPFGGVKESAFGPHEQGRAALEFYTDQITMYVDP